MVLLGHRGFFGGWTSMRDARRSRFVMRERPRQLLTWDLQSSFHAHGPGPSSSHWCAATSGAEHESRFAPARSAQQLPLLLTAYYYLLVFCLESGWAWRLSLGQCTVPRHRNLIQGSQRSEHYTTASVTGLCLPSSLSSANIHCTLTFHVWVTAATLFCLFLISHCFAVMSLNDLQIHNTNIRLCYLQESNIPWCDVSWFSLQGSIINISIFFYTI